MKELLSGNCKATERDDSESREQGKIERERGRKIGTRIMKA